MAVAEEVEELAVPLQWGQAQETHAMIQYTIGSRMRGS